MQHFNSWLQVGSDLFWLLKWPMLIIIWMCFGARQSLGESDEIEFAKTMFILLVASTLTVIIANQ